MTLHVFVGPTLSAADVLAIVPSAVLHPPVAHGDLLRLRLGAGDVAAIVDGYFHHTAAVRHKEILLLLAEGTGVIGCSSMGALRAAELHPFGMVGHGVVFEMYRNAAIDSDDEVAVTHGEAPDYRTFSEPLVMFRHAAAAAVAAGAIDQGAADSIVAFAKALPYADRSWRAVEALARFASPASGRLVGRLRDFVAEHPRYTDVKAVDAAETLGRLDELIAPATKNDLDWVGTTGWRTGYLEEWRTEFSGGQVEGIHVGDGEVLRYLQLYDEDFPHRWRRFVLGRLRGWGADRGAVAPPGTVLEDSLSAGALATAACWGLASDSITLEQKAYWLTAAEIAALAADELLALLLVRSCGQAHTRRALLADEPGLVADEAVRRAVAESHAVNEHIGGWRAGQSTSHIKEEVLRRHVAEAWKLPEASERQLLATARDRGFASFAEAIRAARMFYLQRRFQTLDAKVRAGNRV